MTGLDVNHAVLFLDCAFDEEEPAARDDDAVLLEDIRSEDDVGDAGLIFEGEEDEALGSAWPLTRNDAASQTHVLAAVSLKEINGRENAFLPERCTVIGQRMWAGGETGSCIVRSETLVGRHLPEGNRLHGGTNIETCVI